MNTAAIRKKKSKVIVGVDHNTALNYAPRSKISSAWQKRLQHCFDISCDIKQWMKINMVFKKCRIYIYTLHPKFTCNDH